MSFDRGATVTRIEKFYGTNSVRLRFTVLGVRVSTDMTRKEAIFNSNDITLKHVSTIVRLFQSVCLSIARQSSCQAHFAPSGVFTTNNDNMVQEREQPSETRTAHIAA